MKTIVRCSECKKVLFSEDGCPDIDTSKIGNCPDCDSSNFDVDIG